ncbi:MAG: CoA transferase [Archaeoglobaceae archaeon]|nr:CoA transferase [Archaeoglobaceae archaeon]MDW8117959.1 CoA transferase [Archaeoglobaceae archaeon]
MSRDEALMKLFAEENKPFALEDIKVAEIAGENFAGAIVGSLLAEFGAKVIRVDFDDEAKKISPFGAKVDGYGIPYLVESRNKELVKFDEKVKERIMACDIVIDGMKPGYLDSLGIGYRQISQKNPGVIYLAVSPYGHFTQKSREFANVPDSDLTAQAYNGYPTIIGNPYLSGKYSYPLKAGMWAAWAMAGVNAAIGAMIALIERKKSGKGQFVDVATHDALAVIHSFPTIVGFLFGKPRTRYGTLDFILYPFGYYKVKDGFIALATPTDPDFRALLKIIKRWDLEPDWRYSLDRISDDPVKIKVLDEELNKELQKYTVKELVAKARKKSKGKLIGRFLGAPVIVKLNTLQELLKDPHWKVRNSLISFSPDGKEILIPNTAIKMSETPPRILRVVGKEVKKS